MSLSKSLNFEYAQATIQCDHCGEVEDVRHYCLICQEAMCSTCKAIHNKARATRDHKVVLREERHTKEQTSTFCKKHPDQRTSLHCDTCNVLVCTKCVAETHRGHKFSDVLKVIQKFKREIEDSKEKLETRMRGVNALIYKCEQSWKDYENMIRSIESCISHDATALHSLVDKTARKRNDELNSIKHQDRTTWEIEKGLLDKEKNKISACLEQHDKCLSSTTTSGMAELIQESKELRSKLLGPIEVVPPFYQSPLNTSIEGIGEITKQSKAPTINNSSKLNEIKAKVISSFSSTLKGSPSICFAGNGTVLIGSTESNNMHTVKCEGKIAQKRKNVLKRYCNSLAVTNSGDTLISPAIGNDMDILNRQNKLKTLFDASPYVTRFVTITEMQEFLLCLSRNIIGRHNGHVVLCDGKGGNQRHIGSDDLYEQPIQAVALQDGGFCISDYGKQRLMVLNADCIVKHTIKNPLGRGEFWPRGLCTDKVGKILATDQYNDCVYLIEKDMSVRELVGEAEGIKEPRCLCVDDNNNLWIAQDNGEIKVIKYLEEE